MLGSVDKATSFHHCPVSAFGLKEGSQTNLQGQVGFYPFRGPVASSTHSKLYTSETNSCPGTWRHLQFLCDAHDLLAFNHRLPTPKRQVILWRLMVEVASAPWN